MYGSTNITPASDVKTTASTTMRKRSGDQKSTDVRSCRFIKGARGSRVSPCGGARALTLTARAARAQNKSEGRQQRESVGRGPSDTRVQHPSPPLARLPQAD